MILTCFMNIISICFHSSSDGKQDGKENPAKRPASDINFDMPPPPSPASSTCSEQSGPVLVSPGSATASKYTTDLSAIVSQYLVCSRQPTAYQL